MRGVTSVLVMEAQVWQGAGGPFPQCQVMTVLSQHSVFAQNVAPKQQSLCRHGPKMAAMTLVFASQSRSAVPNGQTLSQGRYTCSFGPLE